MNRMKNEKTQNLRRCIGLQFFAEPGGDRAGEIEARLSEIRTEMDAPGADIDALSAEVDTLTGERAALQAGAEARRALLSKIGAGAVGTEVRAFPLPASEPRQMDAASPEYRTAWLRTLRNNELTELESRAFSTVAGSAGAVVPTQTQNLILQKVSQYAPLLDKITLLRVPGMVKYAIEREQSDAEYHTENGAMAGNEAGLDEVILSAYEITKLVQISKSVRMMAIDAFESWLTDMLAKKVAKVISGTILNGTGTKQGKGIEKSNTWDATNSVTVAKAATLTAQNVFDLVALLPGGYDAGACFLMSKKTLFCEFMPLQDKSKNDLVYHEGSAYYVLGYPVMIDERVSDNTAYLVDLSTVVGNMPEDMTITSDFDVKSNAFLFLACAMFDCLPSQADAVRKLAKGTA